MRSVPLGLCLYYEDKEVVRESSNERLLEITLGTPTLGENVSPSLNYLNPRESVKSMFVLKISPKTMERNDFEFSFTPKQTRTLRMLKSAGFLPLLFRFFPSEMAPRVRFPSLGWYNTSHSYRASKWWNQSRTSGENKQGAGELCTDCSRYQWPS